ncbi:aminotransferase [Dasania sp. GY-MA-18]|uniref:aminotransferase n=1 Tax=Dasania sp. GY-MA-18 TaxID=2966584 RepID=UPI0021AC3403|nr:aminotransferase [Dasania sp. GY-MA-18]MCR8924347.1 aminotransferase [Dasania sp. GY-MA-18]
MSSNNAAANKGQLSADETQAIIDMDRDHHLHPCQIFDVFPEKGALPIAKGEGSLIWDTNGNQYLDAVGGLWCNNIGLGRDEMADVIAEQVRELSYANPFVDMTNVPAAKLAKKLAELAPGHLNHVFFTCGGSTAVDSAYRTVQMYNNCRGKKDKKHFISRKDAYHGTTYASMSLGGKEGDHPDYFDFISDSIHHLSSPNHYRYSNGLSEQDFADQLVTEFEAKIEELGGADKVAAFIAEPIMGAGGVVLPPANYLKRIWEICKANDILYISDEVVTGFGRLGEWFASESVFGIVPDIITCAKGLSSGYLPIGAMIFSEAIFDAISQPGQGYYYSHGYTYSGHPVSCVAALKNIEILEREKILEHVRDVGPYFLEQLNTLRDLDMVGDVRGSHLMVCVELVKNKETRETFPEELDIGKEVSMVADSMGLIVRPIVNLNVMSPPLVLTKEEADTIVSTLRKAILTAGETMKERGHW